MRPLFAIAPLALLLAAFGPRPQAGMSEGPQAPLAPAATATLVKPAAQAPSAPGGRLIQVQAQAQATGAALAQR